MLVLKGTLLSKQLGIALNVFYLIITRVLYTGQKLSTKFRIKDKTKDQHKHDLVYYSKCPEPTCNEDY